MERRKQRGLWKEIGFLLLIWIGMAGPLILWKPADVEAVPEIKGLYFINDQLTDTPSTRNNFVAAGLNFNIRDHLFTKNRMGTSIYFPWTRQSQGERATKSFAPRGVVDLTGKDYTMNINHGIIRNFDALSGERTSRDTAVGLNLTPDKFLPIQFNYRENKALVDPVESTNKNWSVTTELELAPLRLNGGLLQQENASSQDGTLSESDGAFAGMDANWNLWHGTFFHTAYDFSDNKNRTFGNETDNTTHSIALLLDSDLYDWLNLSGSYLLDDTEGRTATDTRAQTLSTRQEISDITVQVIPTAGWALSLHTGTNRTIDDGEVRETDLSSASLSASKEVTSNIDGALSLTRSINDDSEQGESISTSFFITTNMILNPAMTLRINTGVTKSEIPEDPERISSGPGNYATSTNADLWSALTARTSLTVNYSTSSVKDRLAFFGTDSQNLGGTLSYIPKPSVIYNVSAFRHFSDQGETTSSYNGSMAYSFYKGSRMTLSYQRSDGQGQTNDSLSGSFIFVLPKQTNILVNYNLSGLSSDEKTTSLGIQFSKPF